MNTDKEVLYQQMHREETNDNELKNKNKYPYMFCLICILWQLLAQVDFSNPYKLINISLPYHGDPNLDVQK